ncbi:hypothetical protein Ddye_029175 [Dipteronia dyeriana]|uniref:F-box domain-containing protein n=1 Tax=Dipteronia dyeriana TaxID=168575 RepID=A0AAD9WLJ7_9ROSI|nr:hypothetical protein Ddye_029175 [Dipteronia dyeriana]
MSCLVKTFYHYVLSCRFEELDVRKKVQINDQMLLVDRLSSLPDTIIHHILSLMESKYAVRTSAWFPAQTDLFDDNECLELKHLHLVQRDGTKCAAMRKRVKGCCHAKSITMSLNVSKETEEERLLFAFPMVSGFDLNRFATILREMLGGKKTQISNQMEIDRLSNLPEHIIYHILSFMGTEHAVQTSVLSKIWRYDWTHNYNLNIENISNRIIKLKKSQPNRLEADDKKKTYILDLFDMVERLFHVKSLRISLDFPKLVGFCNPSHSLFYGDQVDIHMSPPVDFQKIKWFAAIRDIVKGCCHAKSNTVSLNVSKLSPSFQPDHEPCRRQLDPMAYLSSASSSIALRLTSSVSHGWTLPNYLGDPPARRLAFKPPVIMSYLLAFSAQPFLCPATIHLSLSPFSHVCLDL